MIPQLFVDLDGVLGDFYGHCKSQFGEKFAIDQEDPTELFRLIRQHGSFYQTQPLLPGALDFWKELHKFHPNPIILTGFPQSVPNVEREKQVWVYKNLGLTAKLITCSSKDKFKFGKPKDILIDDRLKYSGYWLEMGGIFLLHKSIPQTLADLTYLYKDYLDDTSKEEN